MFTKESFSRLAVIVLVMSSVSAAAADDADSPLNGAKFVLKNGIPESMLAGSSDAAKTKDRFFGFRSGSPDQQNQHSTTFGKTCDLFVRDGTKIQTEIPVGTSCTVVHSKATRFLVIKTTVLQFNDSCPFVKVECMDSFLKSFVSRLNAEEIKDQFHDYFEINANGNVSSLNGDAHSSDEKVKSGGSQATGDSVPGSSQKGLSVSSPGL